ncbi:MAG: menaquinone biosynthesis protein [Pirellulaceae bacterium]|nr:menaquinone biosynthesis protein [Pirellulaceae bacterium]
MSQRLLKVGAVNYLNTKPLVYELCQFAPQAEVIYDVPSRLADDLAMGKLDVALIPSVEFFQDPTYTIVSDACIACRGPVLSVKLFSRTPPDQIEVLALDEGSRTSVALVQILLRERFGISPQLETLPLGAELKDSTADAVLVIGDRAIHAPEGEFATVSEWDLGQEWCRWSDLPFVFAMWVARAGVDLAGLDVALSAARDAGVKHLAEIAGREADVVRLPFEQCLSYLRDNLYFYLGPQEYRGLTTFYHHAVDLGVAPSGLKWESAAFS